ncbi:hypothetical protein LH446_15990, partial [Laribacter hongkongensis]|uniref:Gp49 family protein n=1 Tax=Laribacter hongkongensis TaxID=168471 RepID=UPI001EFC9C19
RITPVDIEANIASEHYFTAGDGFVGALSVSDEFNERPESERVIEPPEPPEPPEPLELLTFCVLVLKNGFTVTGESACASPENFDAEIGRKVARQNAF